MMDFYSALKLAKTIAGDTGTNLINLSYNLPRKEYTAYIQAVKGYSTHPITLNNKSYGELVDRLEELKASYATD